jgi:hypothetical protein
VRNGFQKKPLTERLLEDFLGRTHCLIQKRQPRTTTAQAEFRDYREF